ncbi:MAG: hypothetical protein CML60_11110, partial [Rhodobacteraceae bacterium]|nr:hypothetical protein [Paracoccaceae bacterium]
PEAQCTRAELDAVDSYDPEVRAASCVRRCPHGRPRFPGTVCDAYSPSPLALCAPWEECARLCRQLHACAAFTFAEVGRCVLHGRECVMGAGLPEYQASEFVVPARNTGFWIRDDIPAEDQDCPLGRGVNIVAAPVVEGGWDRYAVHGLYNLANAAGTTYYQVHGDAVFKPDTMGCGYTISLPIFSNQIKRAAPDNRGYVVLPAGDCVRGSVSGYDLSWGDDAVPWGAFVTQICCDDRGRIRGGYTEESRDTWMKDYPCLPLAGLPYNDANSICKDNGFHICSIEELKAPQGRTWGGLVLEAPEPACIYDASRIPLRTSTPCVPPPAPMPPEPADVGDLAMVLQTYNPSDCAAKVDPPVSDPTADKMWDVWYGAAAIEDFYVKHSCPFDPPPPSTFAEFGGPPAESRRLRELLEQAEGLGLGEDWVQGVQAEAQQELAREKRSGVIPADYTGPGRRPVSAAERRLYDEYGECPPTHYRTSTILFYCEGGEGAAQVNLGATDDNIMTKVAELCTTLYDVRIDLVGAGDIDVQMWQTATGQQLTGDDAGMDGQITPEGLPLYPPDDRHMTGPNQAEEFFNGALYRYSGYAGSEEWIEIEGSLDRYLDLVAKNYAGEDMIGDVTWSYKGVKECAADGNPCGCAECSTYADCPEMYVPYCDGSFDVLCDQNECLSGNHTCHRFATCVDKFGGFDCVCNEGYIGDGFFCKIKPRDPCELEVVGHPMKFSGVYNEVIVGDDQYSWVWFLSPDNAMRFVWRGACMGWVIEQHPEYNPSFKPGEKIYHVDPVPNNCVPIYAGNFSCVYKEIDKVAWTPLWRTNRNLTACELGADYGIEGDHSLWKPMATPMFPLEAPEMLASITPLCMDMPRCKLGTTCEVQYSQVLSELAAVGRTDLTQTVGSLSAELRHHALTYQWGSLHGFPKVLESSERAEAMFRLCERNSLNRCGPTMLYGKKIARTTEGHTRVKVESVPSLTVYTTVSVVRSAAPFPSFHFGPPAGDALAPPPGYALCGDAVRVEVFDEEFAPAAGVVLLKVLLPAPRASRYAPWAWQGREFVPMTSNPEFPSHWYWWEVSVAPGAAVVFIEDVDECADPALNSCESMGDGGQCTNTDGGYVCSCLPGYVKLRDQCMLAENTKLGPTPTAVLISPAKSEYYGAWRVDKIEAYADNACTQQIPISSIKGSLPVPPGNAAYAGDPDSHTSFVSQESLRAPWMLVEAVGVACVEVISCTPELQVAAGRKIDFAGYKTLGPVVNAQEGTSGTIPDMRPPLDPELEWLHFWNVGPERLQPVPAKYAHLAPLACHSLTVPLTVGAEGAQIFGERMLRAFQVPGPFDCLALCSEAIDEGCVAWKYHRETAECQLLRGPLGEGWYPAPQRGWDGWVTGVPPPAVKDAIVEGTTGEATVTLVGSFATPFAELGGDHSLPMRGEPRISVARLAPDGTFSCRGGEAVVEGLGCSGPEHARECLPAPQVQPRAAGTSDRVVFGPLRAAPGPVGLCVCAGDCTEPSYWNPLRVVELRRSLVYMEPSTVPQANGTWRLEVLAGNSGVAGWKAKLVPLRQVRSDATCKLIGHLPVSDVAEERENAVFNVTLTNPGQYVVCVQRGPEAAWEVAYPEGGGEAVTVTAAILVRTPFARQQWAMQTGDGTAMEVLGKNLWPSTYRVLVAANPTEHKSCEPLGTFAGDGMYSTSATPEQASFRLPDALAPGLYDVCWCDPQLDETLAFNDVFYSFVWAQYPTDRMGLQLAPLYTDDPNATDVLISSYAPGTSALGGIVARWERSNAQLEQTAWANTSHAKHMVLQKVGNVSSDPYAVAFTTDFVVTLTEESLGSSFPAAFANIDEYSDSPSDAPWVTAFQGSEAAGILPVLVTNVALVGLLDPATGAVSSMASVMDDSMDYVRHLAITAFSGRRVLLAFSETFQGQEAHALGKMRALEFPAAGGTPTIGGKFEFKGFRTMQKDLVAVSEGNFGYVYNDVSNTAGQGYANSGFVDWEAEEFSIEFGGTEKAPEGGSATDTSSIKAVLLWGMPVSVSSDADGTVLGTTHWGPSTPAARYCPAPTACPHFGAVYVTGSSTPTFKAVFRTFTVDADPIDIQLASGLDLSATEAWRVDVTPLYAGDPTALVFAYTADAGSGVSVAHFDFETGRYVLSQTLIWNTGAAPRQLALAVVGRDELNQESKVLITYPDPANKNHGTGMMVTLIEREKRFFAPPGNLLFTYTVEEYRRCPVNTGLMSRAEVEVSAAVRNLAFVPFCDVICSEGCVGEACRCTAAARAAAPEALCAPVEDCWAVCTQLTLDSPSLCDGVDYDPVTEQCFLTRSCTVESLEESLTMQHWVKNHGAACLELEDFSAQGRH